MLYTLTRIEITGEEETVQAEASTLADALAQFADYFAGDYRPSADTTISIGTGSPPIPFFQ